MDFNLDFIDDELEILKNFNTITSSSRNTDCVESSKKKAKFNSSDVWNHFEKIGMKDGKEKCKYIDCGKVYGCQPAGREGRTSHLLRHILKCPLIPKSMDAGILRARKLDQKAY
ncbi:zinc finger BED domain-containing protein RICESLEEPER 2-like [Abeliophyllum distichum]|uniref:Zinc finger BED domain-containing protein RICESLEEPER 2-like n=1 Tax=Abeliophyllum distichum TaxID=126358 RepID=A0ABD1RBA7_9LAMI